MEVNFDGIVGPSHNYGGLSYGNVASTSHAKSVSNPKSAILQGLEKMKALMDMGVVQGFLPPQERPNLNLLRNLGFSGTDAEVLEKAFRTDPYLLNCLSSASSMWTANAACVSPSADSEDNKVHFTPANLVNKLHRSIEHESTGLALKKVFSNEKYFSHHASLPSHDDLGDEGAANHTRLCSDYAKQGLQVFVYGKEGGGRGIVPKKFPARQTKLACEAIVRKHQLRTEHVVLLQQNPDVIDQGVFHNDVISVGNKDVFFYHEHAFMNQKQAIEAIEQKFSGNIKLIEVPQNAVSVEDAVSSYLFNSQLVETKEGICLIAPTDCQENERVKTYIDEMISQNLGIDKVRFFDLKQSMRNGGGPACLRLRVCLNEEELQAVNQNCILTEKKYIELKAWAERNYREEMRAEDLRDPAVYRESCTALDELTQIMDLGALYDFQK